MKLPSKMLGRRSRWSIFVLMLYRIVVFIVPAVDPFVEIFRRSWLVRIVAMEVLKFLWAAGKVPHWVPDWIWIVASPANTISQGSSYDLAGKDFFDLPFVLTIDLNWQRRFIILAWQWVFRGFVETVG